jgi:hypothetical protein
MSEQNNVRGPNGAIPVFNGGALFDNVTTSVNTQVKTGPGVLQSIGVNTGGTTSSVAMYDGVSEAVTITIATPGVVTWPAGAKPAAGTAVKLTNAGGALPTGITADTTYYVSTAGATANAAQIADTQAHALAGTNSINTSGSQSGVQTAWDVSEPIGTYATTAQGNVPVGAAFTRGLIAISADGGGAANLTILYV